MTSSRFRRTGKAARDRRRAGIETTLQSYYRGWLRRDVVEVALAELGCSDAVAQRLLRRMDELKGKGKT